MHGANRSWILCVNISAMHIHPIGNFRYVKKRVCGVDIKVSGVTPTNELCK